MVANESTGSILVVDDNPLIVNVLKNLLASENYQVYSAANGKEALSVLDKKAIDVVVCDVMMPHMDGYELHHNIRQKAECAHIPFVFLTALGDNVEITKGKESGADEYVVKPFQPENLLAIVRGKVVRSRNLKNLSEERYDHYRKRVIHTLSHEFRTPLVAINTGTELLIDQHGKLDIEKAKNLLEAIRRGGQRLENLVNDFMLLQQIEAGIALRLYDTRAAARVFSELINDALSSQEDLISREGFRLEVVNNTTVEKVKVYDIQIYDIIGRIISNCLKFRTDNRTIEVHLYPQHDELVAEIRDRGLGINLDRVKEVIDVFGQIDREKLEQQGGGLGLAIASRYAHINKGRLEFDRRNGGGSIVSLILPKLQ